MRKNKTILITGAAVRLGRELALSLAKNGYDIILHYNRSKQHAEELRKKIKKYKVRCWLYQSDLTKGRACENLINYAFEKSENFYGIINNASIFVKRNLLETSNVELLKIFIINCFVPVILTKLFANRLNKKGIVINILDCRITKNDCSAFAYTLSKKTLALATEMLAKEFAPKIRVNAISPGPIIPPDSERTGIKEKAGELPLMIRPQIEDIIKSMLLLLKAESITGETIFVDSGQHINL